jgi:phenylpropionate dioxygenase-like ring-hydroxylating dioxygenase large terminal subunit
MEQKLFDHLQRRLRYTETRSAPPRGFPDFPTIHPGRYYDPDYAELEQTHVFRKSWMVAGHKDEIPEPGCYKTWNRAGEPVVLFHGQDGEIRAFYNVCRHRGAVITEKEFGRTRTLACAYHGWIYDNQGKLVSIRDQRDFPDFDPNCYSLVPIRTEMLGGLIFVNFDDNATDLRSSMGPIYDDFAGDYSFHLSNVVEHFAWPTQCNWKLLIEGGTENYHVRTIHRNTLPDYRELQGIITLFPNGGSRDTLLMHVPKDENGLAMEGFVRNRDADRLIDNQADDRPANPNVDPFSNEHGFVYSVFPNMQFGPFYSRGFSLSCYWPTGLGTAIHEYYILGYDRSGGPKSKFWDRDIAQGRAVLQEDLDYINMVQRGIVSRGNKGVKLGYLEARLYHMNQTLDEKIGREKIKPELLVEPVINSDWIYPNDISRYEADMDRIDAELDQAAQ